MLDLLKEREPVCGAIMELRRQEAGGLWIQAGDSGGQWPDREVPYLT